MQSCHAATAVDVVFDDRNLIADAGLVPVVALAEQVGVPDLVSEHVTITGAANSAGANPAVKVMSLLAGMVAGADSIADVDRLRHAGNAVVFDEIRAPSTLGTFLRAFTHGHVQQLNVVLRQTLVRLAERAPLLPGADEVVFVDLDSTHRQVYGYAKQGAAVGRLKGKKTLHPLIATATGTSGPYRTARAASPIPAGATSGSKVNLWAWVTGSARPRSAGSSNDWAYPQRRSAATTPRGAGSSAPRHPRCWRVTSSMWTAR
jgi:hypothetical protein